MSSCQPKTGKYIYIYMSERESDVHSKLTSKISVKQIKHPAPQLVKDNKRNAFDVRITQRSTHISALKRVNKGLEKILRDKTKKITCVKVLAMGRLIKKALAVGLDFQKKGYKVEIFTGTLTVTDEFDDGGEYEPTMKQRKVSKVELNVFPREE